MQGFFVGAGDWLSVGEKVEEEEDWEKVAFINHITPHDHSKFHQQQAQLEWCRWSASSQTSSASVVFPAKTEKVHKLTKELNNTKHSWKSRKNWYEMIIKFHLKCSTQSIVSPLLKAMKPKVSQYFCSHFNHHKIEDHWKKLFFDIKSIASIKFLDFRIITEKILLSLKEKR